MAVVAVICWGGVVVSSVSSSLAGSAPVHPRGAVSHLPQSIIFALPAQAAVDDTLTLEATGGASGQPVVLSVFSGPGVLVGNQLSFTEEGTVVIHATQAGNASYDPAPELFVSVSARANIPPLLYDDIVKISNSSASIAPLANDVDFDGDLLTITGVSDPTVSIEGRHLIIPAGFTGDFTYDATDGFATTSATVTVLPVPTVSNALRYSGVLFDPTGLVVGRVQMLVNPKGTTSLELSVGALRTAGVFAFGPTGGTATTSAGSLVLVRKPDGTVNATLGALIGLLRPSPARIATERQHIALASLGNFASLGSGDLPVPRVRPRATVSEASEPIPGGGYIIMRVLGNATVILQGRLPDGCPYAAGAIVNDIDSIAFYNVEKIAVTSRGFVGGELLRADLERTDVTGELTWVKPPQIGGSRYTHRGGVKTLLQANGCLYRGIDLDGPSELQLSGGDLPAGQDWFVDSFGGRPDPTGALIDWFPRPGPGTFSVRIRTPFSKHPVIGGGIYLPKIQRAWGYFGSPTGGNVGGRIDVQMDGVGDFPPE